MPKVKPYTPKRKLLETLEGYVEASRCKTLDRFTRILQDAVREKPPATLKPYDINRRLREIARKTGFLSQTKRS